ncbi:MAG: hypothetical protein ACFN0W_04760 [Propionibacterium acidifaciens]|uniref:hypothetical protein n=1 Tax=Propionibacterium acidifaciens TaxID=556499 RepID=UPI00360AAFED
MSNPVSIAHGTNSIVLYAPYNLDFVGRARQLSGRWDRTARGWRFDARDEALVRDLAIEFFGTDGSPETLLVTARLDLTGRSRIDEPQIVVAGRIVAERRERDAEVHLADGVIVASGEFAASGGSMKRPAIGEAAGVVLEIRDVPARAAAREGLEIVEEQGADREALLAERERLAARIAEIDGLLGGGEA